MCIFYIAISIHVYIYINACKNDILIALCCSLCALRQKVLVRHDMYNKVYVDMFWYRKFCQYEETWLQKYIPATVLCLLNLLLLFFNETISLRIFKAEQLILIKLLGQANKIFSFTLSLVGMSHNSLNHLPHGRRILCIAYVLVGDSSSDIFYGNEQRVNLWTCTSVIMSF